METQENKLNKKEQPANVYLNSDISEPENTDTAIVAGGCFWCIEASIEQVNGVISAISGYTGGDSDNPTYQTVTSGKTGHYEAVEIKFDKTIISYEKVIQKFYNLFDPTDNSGSFADKGSQYKSAVFYKNKDEKIINEKIIKELTNSEKYNKPIVTKLIENQTFFIAEEYHQDYYKKAPIRYNTYKKYSGREQYYKEMEDK